MKVHVNKEACIGCELCSTISPDVFQMGESGIAYIAVELVPVDLQKSVEEAAYSCPVDSIKIR